jgi:hypothetical protein
VPGRTGENPGKRRAGLMRRTSGGACTIRAGSSHREVTCAPAPASSTSACTAPRIADVTVDAAEGPRALLEIGERRLRRRRCQRGGGGGARGGFHGKTRGYHIGDAFSHVLGDVVRHRRPLASHDGQHDGGQVAALERPLARGVAVQVQCESKL